MKFKNKSILVCILALFFVLSTSFIIFGATFTDERNHFQPSGAGVLINMAPLFELYGCEYEALNSFNSAITDRFLELNRSGYYGRVSLQQVTEELFQELLVSTPMNFLQNTRDILQSE